MQNNTPWLDVILSRIGVHEVAGPASNPTILSWFAACGHPEIDDDETAWCSITVGASLKECGLPIPPVNVNMLARSWLTYGVRCAPQPGAIGVWPRGNSSWQGHVAIVEAVNENGTVTVIGGNQGRAPGEVCRAWYRIDDALDFRMPVRATVEDLRAAGSTEIKKGDDVQKVGLLASLVSCLMATLSDLLNPITSPAATLPEGLSFTQQVLEGINAVFRLLGDYPWLAGAVLASTIVIMLGSRIKSGRVAKAEAGAPLSRELAAVAPGVARAPMVAG